MENGNIGKISPHNAPALADSRVGKSNLSPNWLQFVIVRALLVTLLISTNLGPSMSSDSFWLILNQDVVDTPSPHSLMWKYRKMLVVFLMNSQRWFGRNGL